MYCACAYAYAACTVHFSTGGNFTELHTLTLAARSYYALSLPTCQLTYLPTSTYHHTCLPTYPPMYPPSYVPSCLPTRTYLSVTEKPLQVCCHLVLGVNQSSSLLPQLSALSTAHAGFEVWVTLYCIVNVKNQWYIVGARYTVC